MSRCALRSMTAAIAAVIALPTAAPAQDRMTAEQLAVLAAKPTPTLGGKPDLNGTWDHLGGIEFIRPERLPDGTVCLRGCAPAGGRAAGAGAAAAAPAGAARSAAGAANLPPAVAATSFPKYKPEFQAKVKELDVNQVKHDTVLQCRAPGVPRIGPPQKIIQTARELVFLYDDVSGGFFRIVPIDGRPHRRDLPPSYLGDAIGRFEGDTLVVETVNFNEDTWLTDNGAFHTRELRVVERLRRRGDTIEYQAVAHDPAVLAEPWTARVQALWLTDRELEEPSRCDDRDLAHMVDGSHHTNPR